jgi:hypothetical protein
VSVWARSEASCASNSSGSGSNVAMQTAIRSPPGAARSGAATTGTSASGTSASPTAAPIATTSPALRAGTGTVPQKPLRNGARPARSGRGIRAAAGRCRTPSTTSSGAPAQLP